MSSSCDGRRNMWEFRLTTYSCTRYTVLQEALVKGLKLHTRYHSPRTTLSENLMSSWGVILLYKTSITFPDKENGECFTSARLRPVESLPSGLHAHGALVTVWAPIRSGPSFLHYMYQWARRLSRVELAVILRRSVGPSTMVVFKLRTSLWTRPPCP